MLKNALNEQLQNHRIVFNIIWLSVGHILTPLEFHLFNQNMSQNITEGNSGNAGSGGQLTGPNNQVERVLGGGMGCIGGGNDNYSGGGAFEGGRAHGGSHFYK